MGIRGLRSQESRNVLAWARAFRAAQCVDQNAWEAFLVAEERDAGLR